MIFLQRIQINFNFKHFQTKVATVFDILLSYFWPVFWVLRRRLEKNEKQNVCRNIILKVYFNIQNNVLS